MKYERLTKHNNGTYYIKKCDKAHCDGYCGGCKFGVDDEIRERLGQFEDKIEAGTLVELPCKVGDKVFIIAKQGMDIYTVEETTVWDFWFSTTENRFYPIDANEIPLEKVFLTKAEAEKQLEGLRGAK